MTEKVLKRGVGGSWSDNRSATGVIVIQSVIHVVIVIPNVIQRVIVSARSMAPKRWAAIEWSLYRE